MNSAKDYAILVNEPWGKMFYDLLFIQLELPISRQLKVLDFGSGIGVAASHYAAWHEVTAVEPDQDMIDNSWIINSYEQIHGDYESLAAFSNGYFDVALCHNVLEYIEDKEPVIAEIMRVIKPGGLLSLVKHNRVGKVFQTAIFANDPQKALFLTDESANYTNNYLGRQYVYSNDEAAKWLEYHGGKINRILGMRTFFALGQDNSVKYSDEWYRNMLALESHVADVDEYKNAAFLNHLLIDKS